MSNIARSPSNLTLGKKQASSAKLEKTVVAADPMKVRDRLIQETEDLPEAMLTEVLNFLQFLKARSSQNLMPMSDDDYLTARIDYLEAILGIQKGLASFDRGDELQAIEALNSLEK